MKKVLLISNYIYHYRINNYNYFYQQFKKKGIDFQILADDMQKVDFAVEVPVTLQKPGLLSSIGFIRKNRPDCIILFLHLKDLYILPLVLYCRAAGIPVVYWNFGIDLGDPYNKMKNSLYRSLHLLANGILLYSPNELLHIKPKNRPKTFIANNTVNMTAFEGVSFEGNYLKDHYGIKEKFIVLFVGRILPVKRIDELLKCFRGNYEVAVVIAGKGIPQDLLDIINNQPNYYYLGEIKYDRQEIARVYSGADVVCIPGNVGLAIVEAFFWGKPIVTMVPKRAFNSPEIWYLKDGENGYITHDATEMEEKITTLLVNPQLYKQFSEKAKEVALAEAHISKMFEGFCDVVDHLTS